MNLKPSTVCVSLPEVYSRRKLNALYREIPLKDTTSRLLRKYFNAMANLYGIIPLRKAYEIISAQCRHPVSKEEFLSFQRSHATSVRNTACSEPMNSTRAGNKQLPWTGRSSTSRWSMVI